MAGAQAKPSAKAYPRSREPTASGLTAALNSAAKFDHIKTGGTLLNQKLNPQLLEDDAGLGHFIHLVRADFSKTPTTSSSTWSPAKPCWKPANIRKSTAT